MKSLTVFALSFWLAAALNIKESNILENNEISERIVNGETAKTNEYPYEAGIALDNGLSGYNWCSGALISNEWVITAAHCTEDARNATVYLGSNSRANSLFQYKVTKKDIISHSDYDRITFINDIGLIKIPRVTYTDAIQNIILPKIGDALSFGSIVTASGWGKTDENASVLSPILLHADLKVISNEKCKEIYGAKNIDFGKLCAQHYQGGAICSGDSGGPLVLKTQTGRKVLVGIASFGSARGCRSDVPDGFTRVTSYLIWIMRKTGLRF